MTPGACARRTGHPYPCERRLLKIKTDSLRTAIGALCDRGLAPVRSVTASCDRKGHWQLNIATGSGRLLPSVLTETFSIHYPPRERCAQTAFEQARIQRFLAMLRRRGIHPRRIVTGTKTGPDMMIRLADGSPAIVEVKCDKSANQLRSLLAERYDYLLDTFKLFCACEYQSGNWHIWRVRRSGCEKVTPEALNG